MLVYIKTSSTRKRRNPTAKQRLLQDSWAKLLAKYDIKPSKALKKSPEHNPPIRPVTTATSLATQVGNCNVVPVIMYTGDALIGLSTMHKSNTVPVFSKEEAEAHAKMRRG